MKSELRSAGTHTIVYVKLVLMTATLIYSLHFLSASWSVESGSIRAA